MRSRCGPPPQLVPPPPHRCAPLTSLACLPASQVQRVLSEVAKRRDAGGQGIILFDDFRKWYMQSEQRMRADLDEMWARVVGEGDADMETATRLVATLLGLNILSVERAKVEEHLKDMDADKDGKVRRESPPPPHPTSPSHHRLYTLHFATPR